MNKKKNLEEKQPSNKQPVSIMISGVSGSGKSTIARLFAQFCEEYGLEHTVRDANGSSDFAPLDEMVNTIRKQTVIKIQTEQQRERKIGTIKSTMGTISNDSWIPTPAYTSSEPDWDALAAAEVAMVQAQAVSIPITPIAPQDW